MELEQLLKKIEGRLGEFHKKVTEDATAANDKTVEELKRITDSFEAKFSEHKEEVLKVCESTEKMQALGKRIEGITEIVGKIEMQVMGRKTAPLMGLDDKDVKKFSYHRCFKAIKNQGNFDRHAPFEKDVMQEYEKVMQSTLDSGGGYWVPPETASEVIELIRDSAVMRALGIRVLDNLSRSPFRFPKKTQAASFFWVGEGKVPTRTDVLAGMLTFTPKKVAALVRVSNDLLNMDTVPDIERLIREDLAEGFGLAEDAAILTGTGSEYQPLGLTNMGTDHVQELEIGAANQGDDPAYLDIVDLFGLAENVLLGQNTNLVAVFNTRVKTQLLAVLDVNGRPIFFNASDPARSATTRPNDFFGVPFGVTNQLSSILTKGSSAANKAQLLCGRADHAMLARWGTFRLDVSAEAGDTFEKDESEIRAIGLMDFKLRQDLSWAMITDVNTVRGSDA